MRATLVRFGFRWASQHPKWAFGFVDEIWWSRVVFPSLHTWTEADRSLPLAEQTVTREDGKKALACYGLLLPRTNELWLRFVEQIHLCVQQEEYHDTDPFS
jgi:hypothetical protein